MCVDCLSTRCCSRRFRISYYRESGQVCPIASGKAEEAKRRAASRDTHTETGYISVLYRAAASNNVALVRRVLRRAAHNSKFDINQATVTGGTALIYASQHGSDDALKILLQFPGINVNLPLHNGRTPLFMACQSGHVFCVQHLLNVPGIKVNKAKDTGETPLLIACQEGYMECVISLMSHPTIKVDQATKNGRTPLQMACYGGHVHVVNALLVSSLGVDINKRKMQGSTALWLASQRGHSEVVKSLLIHQGIRVNDADDNGQTSLHAACEYGHVECVRAMLRVSGIDVTRKARVQGGGAEEFSLYDAAARNDHREVMDLLQEFGLGGEGQPT
jgi:ankyrin repeat protein